MANESPVLFRKPRHLSEHAGEFGILVTIHSTQAIEGSSQDAGEGGSALDGE